MKVLVTGYQGQLGYDVVRLLENRGIDCRGVDIEDFDLTDRQAVMSFVMAYQPDAIIHCAAFTAVDKAEDLRELCFAINVTGTEHMALAAAKVGACLMYISTDYVFKGDGEHYFEVDEEREPQNYYGLTKSLGEDVVRRLLPDSHFIVRISWVFGLNGKSNFIKTMLRLGKEREEISVVSDQVGSPTYTFDLARLLCDMIVTDRFGTYHATNEGECSWYDIASAIIQMAELKARIKPITTDQYPTRASRPRNSRLSKASLDLAGFQRLPDWQDALARYLADLPVNQ